MIAETLNCRSCGAAVSSDDPVCQHCGARLAAIVCHGCMRMMFQGSQFCPHCGRPAIEWKPTDSPLLCPRCELAMLRGEVGAYLLHECPKCFGVWVDKTTLDHLCRDAQREAVPPAPTGAADPSKPPISTPLEPVRYVRCPDCRQLMNRVNFAQSSGVVLDRCSTHGTWFDAQELHRCVEFIRSGGLDRAREREKAQLAEERRKRRMAETHQAERAAGDSETDLLSLIARAASGRFGRF